MTRKRILVVDDGITMRLFYRDVLENAGFAVEEAANGIEGLEHALVGRFDLMVVDVNMPKMNGYEFVRQVRDNPEIRGTPILTISTEEKDSDAQLAYAAGANYYIVKPAQPANLIATANLLSGGPS